MTKSFLGVEIGNTSVRFVEVNGGKILKYEEIETPKDLIAGDDTILSEDGIIDFLRTFRKKSGIKEKRVAIVLPEDGVFVRNLNLPPMTAGQLDINLPYEFRDYITEEKDKYIYDYKMIGLVRDENDKVKSMDLVAVAARKDMIEKYERIFKMAGYKLNVAIPYYISLGNLMRSLNVDIEKSDYAVLHLGDVSTAIAIFSEGFYDMGRIIENGILDLAYKASEILGISSYSSLKCLMDDSDEIINHPEITDICANIAVSVARSINYYNYQKGDNNLTTMYVTGQGVFIKPLYDAMRDNVPLDLVLISDMAENTFSKEALIMAPTALGACFNTGEAFHE